MSRNFIITLMTVLIVAVVGGGAIFFAKGYTLSPKEGKVIETGIISVTSLPDGASLYLDGHLTSATNTTISQLKPKSYTVKLAKEGFIPWEKTVEVKQGLVTEVKATLFPAIPTIYPLTFNGIIDISLSPDGQKLAFTVPYIAGSQSRQKGGVWVWTMGNQPISFARSAEPHQIAISDASLDFAKASLTWSPDSKQLLVTLHEGNNTSEASLRNYLLSVDQLTSSTSLRDITPTVAATLKGWEEDQSTKDEASILAIKDLILRKTASDSAKLLWSPDETKFISGGIKPKTALQAPATKVSPIVTPASLLSGYVVYSLEESKSYNLPEAKSYQWLPDSKHIVMVEEGKISVVDFDGTNVAVIFAGSFEDSLVFPWPDSSRLVMVSSYNTPTASQPNLLGINLK